MARSRREAVAQADFAEAIERVVAGLEKKPRPQRQREKIVAYHEVGHAIVIIRCQGWSGREDLIVPRGWQR